MFENPHGRCAMDELEQLRHTYTTEADAVGRAWEVVREDQFRKACDLLLHAPRIGASGCGNSGIACMHLVHLLCCVGRPARYIYPSEGVHGALGFLHGGDVLVVCSRSGRSTELMPLVESCRDKHVSIIAVSEVPSSLMCRRADVTLKLMSSKEVDRFNLQGTTSFAITNALFDALTNAIINRVGFTTTEYALDHPGGAAGDRLSQDDLMHEPSD